MAALVSVGLILSVERIFQAMIVFASGATSYKAPEYFSLVVDVLMVPLQVGGTRKCLATPLMSA
jgi:hypothetical protein